MPVRCFPPFDMEIKTLLDNLHEEVPCSVCQCKFNLRIQSSCLACARDLFNDLEASETHAIMIISKILRNQDIFAVIPSRETSSKHVKIPFCNWLIFRKLIKISCKKTICETFFLCLLLCMCLCFLPLNMDIKTLLDNLHDEVSCSVCMCKFTDPKQLPCLHSFCLHCLNGIQRTSANPNVIACPECRQECRVPENGNLQALPTNFRINSLLDVLTIKERNTTAIKCGNCDKKSLHSFYCFQCCGFWCDDCISLHDGIKAYKEHHALSLKNFQDQDFENILRRPAFCGKPGHEKKELEFFCKSCEAAICYSCIATLHEGHPKILLDEAANERKLHVKAAIESKRQITLQKRENIARIQGNCLKILGQIDSVKKDAQKFVDSMIAALEATKQEIFNDVEKKANETLLLLVTKQREMESQVAEIETAIEKAEQILKRRTNAEITRLDTNTIFQGECNDGDQVECDFENLRHFVFIQNEMLMEKVNSGGIGTFRSFLSKTVAQQSSTDGEGVKEATVGLKAHIVVTTRTADGVQCFEERDFVKVEISDRQGHDCATELLVEDNTDGTYKISYFAKETGTCEASVKVNGEHVRGSPFKVQVKARQFKPVLSFGQEGSSFEPWGVAVNERDEIAATDRGNHRVQIFDSDGTFLRSFGRKGDKEGELNEPCGIAFHDGNIVVSDRNNHRVQVFSAQGEFLFQFGGEGNLDHQLNLPLGLSVDSEGNFIVADPRNKSIKVFSARGHFLHKIGTAGFFNFPFNCIQHDNHLAIVVSDTHEHCLKVFNKERVFLVKFGNRGYGNGEFNGPRCLSVNKAGHLMVCDTCNHRVQVFEMSGKFVTKFGCYGSKKGEFDLPVSTAVLSDGKIVVSDFRNNRVQVFE